MMLNENWIASDSNQMMRTGSHTNLLAVAVFGLSLNQTEKAPTRTQKRTRHGNDADHDPENDGFSMGKQKESGKKCWAREKKTNQDRAL
jgi:hypothetical protein